MVESLHGRECHGNLGLSWFLWTALFPRWNDCTAYILNYLKKQELDAQGWIYFRFSLIHRRPKYNIIYILYTYSNLNLLSATEGSTVSFTMPRPIKFLSSLLNHDWLQLKVYRIYIYFLQTLVCEKTQRPISASPWT